MVHEWLRLDSFKETAMMGVLLQTSLDEKTRLIFLGTDVSAVIEPPVHGPYIYISSLLKIHITRFYG